MQQADSNPMKLTPLTLVAALGAAFTFGALAADKPFHFKTKPYPMDTCVVSGEKLGSMGDAYVVKEGDQEIQLCCKSCEKDFKKNKKALVAKVADASKKVKAYPLATCIVSGEKLETASAVGAVHEGREFGFCCKDCTKEFKKDTAKYVKKFDEAFAAKK